MHVGFIGLGDMGGAMAVRIAKSAHQLHVWARSAHSLTQFDGLDVIVHDTPADLAGAVEHLGICVTSESDVQSVLVDSGAMAALPAGGVIALHATLSPGSVIAFAEAATQYGHRLVDAPVSGMREGAEAGRLMLMIGAQAADLEAAMPVLQTYSNDVCRIGDVGAGQTVKILNNLVMNANLTVAHLVLQLGERMGMARPELRELLLRGSAASRCMDVLDRTVIPGAWSPVNARKDLSLAAELLADEIRGDALLEEIIAVAREVREDMGPKPAPVS